LRVLKKTSLQIERVPGFNGPVKHVDTVKDEWTLAARRRCT